MSNRSNRKIQEPPFRYLAREFPEFRDAYIEFEKLHGTEWAELLLILLHDLRHIQMPDRFEAGFSLLSAKLRDDKSEIRRAIAKSAALARHAENHAMKSQVFTWLDENMSKYRSMDSAAEAVAGVLVPVTFRTVRSWVGEWKKQHPAGKL